MTLDEIHRVIALAFAEGRAVEIRPVRGLSVTGMPALEGDVLVLRGCGEHRVQLADIAFIDVKGMVRSRAIAARLRRADRWVRA